MDRKLYNDNKKLKKGASAGDGKHTQHGQATAHQKWKKKDPKKESKTPQEAKGNFTIQRYLVFTDHF